MISVVVAMMLQAAAPGAGQAAGPAVTTPDWRRRPTAEEAQRVYPRVARRRGVLSGAALLVCQVDRRGLLVECVVADEAPKDLGFGEATLKLADKFEMRPQTRNGVPVDSGTVRIPLRFSAPSGVR